ncbi:MAG: hypothetical protein LBI14_04170 [Treponema sp.]|jgi:hypothetical protein|nr:hypothetical protein [Treponema sp.]
MADTNDYKKTLSDALTARADWLEKSELPKLKDALRTFQMGFASLYNLYLKKGLVIEDPYKQEVKIGELEVPESGPFTEAKRLDQLSLRLSNYDTQMDFLVNFYQFSADFLTLDRLKRIVNLVKYIDWVNLTPDSQSVNTKAAAEITTQVKLGTDPMTMNVITESLSNLNKQFPIIMGHLKTLVDYRRELYKLELRESVTSQMATGEASQLPQIKKKFAQANPGKSFYPDLAEEIIKEDFTSEGPALREKILASLQVAEVKAKVVKQQVPFKTILLEGIQCVGSTAQTFIDVSTKLEENRAVLESEKKGFWIALKKIFRQMLNKEPEAVIYELDYIDPIKGVPIQEKLNVNNFQNDLTRKIKILTSMSSKGTGMAKLETMQDEQLISFLEKNIRDLQSYHKTLTALDEFFKAEVEKEHRDKIKGIKPELGTIKNAILRANSRRHEYSAQKEEEEQLKRLGVNPSAQGS